MAGLRLPVESHILQAFVTEPIKPIVDHVVSWGAELFYLSQSDKGGLVFGGHIDGFNTYTQRGQFPRIQTVAECAVSLMPFISRLRLLRHWGGILQGRAGSVRHDAVAWGYARAADTLGVDIIENCEVEGFVIEDGKVTGVETSRGRINAGKVGIAVAGHTSHVAKMAGLRLPVESHILQAFVTEPIKPMVHHVVYWGAELFYLSQSD